MRQAERRPRWYDCQPPRRPGSKHALPGGVDAERGTGGRPARPPRPARRRPPGRREGLGRHRRRGCGRPARLGGRPEAAPPHLAPRSPGRIPCPGRKRHRRQGRLGGATQTPAGPGRRARPQVRRPSPPARPPAFLLRVPPTGARPSRTSLPALSRLSSVFQGGNMCLRRNLRHVFALTACLKRGPRAARGGPQWKEAAGSSWDSEGRSPFPPSAVRQSGGAVKGEGRFNSHLSWKVGPTPALSAAGWVRYRWRRYRLTREAGRARGPLTALLPAGAGSRAANSEGTPGVFSDFPGKEIF